MKVSALQYKQSHIPTGPSIQVLKPKDYDI